jgi:hypothetical protein
MPRYEVNVELIMRGDATFLVEAESAEAAKRCVEEKETGPFDWEEWLDLADMELLVDGIPVEQEEARQQRIACGEETACRECGCSVTKACAGGCYWVEPDLCSVCEAKEAA